MLRNLVMFVIVFVSSLSAFALPVDSQATAGLPAIRVIAVEVDNGPRFAAVQPTAMLKFAFSSCAEMSFVPSIEEENGVLFVSVKFPGLTFDCMGPSIEREYSVQISSDFRNSVVVLNPVVKLYK